MYCCVPLNLQIFLWEQNLEQFHMDLFRFRCYLASLQGGELPNPKRLLAFASRPTKLAMGRLGIFSVSSFHALVNILSFIFAAEANTMAYFSVLFNFFFCGKRDLETSKMYLGIDYYIGDKHLSKVHLSNSSCRCCRAQTCSHSVSKGPWNLTQNTLWHHWAHPVMLLAGQSSPKTTMHCVKPRFSFFKNNDYAIYELGSHVGHPFVRVLVQFWPPTAAAKRLCTSHLKALVVKENIWFFSDVSQITEVLFPSPPPTQCYRAGGCLSWEIAVKDV